MSVVLDASAVLAYLLGEPGGEAVKAQLQGAAIGAANLSEVAQKILRHDRNWDEARALLAARGVEVQPVTEDDAEWAARRWKRGEDLSLADRLCLALGARRSEDVLTADRSWGSGKGIRQVR